MRALLAAVLLALVPLAPAQFSLGEARALDDAMTLANLRPEDLRKIAPPTGAKPAHLRALRDPMTEINEATALHSGATGDERALLRTAYRLLGSVEPTKPGGEVVEVPTVVPESLARPVGTLVAAIAAANAEIRAATARLSAEEKRFLIEGLGRLAVDDATLPLDFAKTPTGDFVRVRRLLELVDEERILRAGMALAETVRETIPVLQAIPDKKMESQVFQAGGFVVELAGDGPDVHNRRDVGLSIDLGGDDRYAGRYGAGIGYAAVCIDLGGNDRYGGVDANLGVGLIGIGILHDLDGDDVYGVRSTGIGCGMAGLGAVVDASGDDRYRVGSLGLGVGVRGVGLVSDRLGDDVYDAGRNGEGFGLLGGVGWCVDGAGNDLYRGGEAVQAFGRESGVGLLTDLVGNDLYRAVSGQAQAEGGYASLGDLRGDDGYVAERGQALASGGGFAALIEMAGDDGYFLKRGLGQAAAFGAVAILRDRSGNDVYGGTEGAPAATVGGVALLLEAEGDDRYLASASFSAGGEGASIWADGGGRDRYGDGRGDAQAAAGSNHAAYDVAGAADLRPANPLPKPGSIPAPPAAELSVLAKRAAQGPDRSAALARLVGIGLPALDALAAEPDSGLVPGTVAARIGPSAAPTVARWLASNDPRLVRAALSTAGFVPLPPEPVIAALAKPETTREAAVASGRAKLAAALPTLMRLAAGNDPAPFVAALAQIGDPQAAATGAALIDHVDLAVRQAAFRTVLLQPSLAQATGVRLAAMPDGFHQRIGLALLGAVGTPEALAQVGPYLGKGREAKIGALLALDGQVPVGLIPAVEALRRDSDPLVRAVAERIDAG